MSYPLPSGVTYLECERDRILRQLEAAEDAKNLDLWNHLWCELAKINRLIEVNP